MLKLIKKIKYPLTILLIAVIIIVSIYLKNNLAKQKYQSIKIGTDELELVNNITYEKEEKQDICSVDVKGAVINPGVYLVECSNNVNDVIKISGGLSENADTSVINLAKKISNEMVIIIYTKDEVKNSNIVDTVIKTIEKECVCPNIQNDGCINDNINGEIGSDNGSLVNINTATLEKLQTLPGIGESKAKAIIKYREESGMFKNIDDILNVDGIGSKLYEEIKAYITT